jgi:glycosyltransferase involved in cell wall biosynthesis
LGYLDDREYYGLLERTWALVMPTFYEGGGSFPTMEALQRGVPVLCSDIPVLREQMQEMKAEVLWFDPCSPETLVTRLVELTRSYMQWKRLAERQVANFHSRTWRDVAGDYARVFASAAPELAPVFGRSIREF